jgi:hypothetical protein
MSMSMASIKDTQPERVETVLIQREAHPQSINSSTADVQQCSAGG